MRFNEAIIAAQTAFHFGDRETFITALHLAQHAADGDAAIALQLSAAIAKFPTNEALEIVVAAEMQHHSRHHD